MDIGGANPVPANRPLALFEFLNTHPRDRSQRFAFDRDHRFGDPLDEVPFLFGREHSFDHFDVY